MPVDEIAFGNRARAAIASVVTASIGRWGALFAGRPAVRPDTGRAVKATIPSREGRHLVAYLATKRVWTNCDGDTDNLRRGMNTPLDMVLASRATAMADIADDHGRGSKFERVVNTAASWSGVASLLAPWTAAMKQLSNLVIVNDVPKAAREIAAGTADAKTIERLAPASIWPDPARLISAEFGTHGEMDGGSRRANTGGRTDRETPEALHRRALIGGGRCPLLTLV